ncbi:MAG: 6-phosphogluconolactonase [Candidatus Moranbacteria bacterium]|nr:6-phosphogluconolactonase [Candidatus Moranbacteria bacterium]
MKINSFPLSEEAKYAAAESISMSLLELKKKDVPVLFLFSGGSALSVLDMIDFSCLGEHLTLAPVDERFDPTGEASNFSAFMATSFYGKAEVAGARFIDTRVKEGQGMGDLANGFETTLRKWMADFVTPTESSYLVIPSVVEESCPHPHGKIIAILGMGPDGHTAGIFPSDDAQEFHDRFEGDRLVVGYRAPEYAICPERITATLSFLEKNVDQAFVFLSGEEKRAAWERVLQNDEPIHLLPAGIFHSLQGVELFTDLG